MSDEDQTPTAEEEKTPAAGPMLSRFAGPGGRALLLQVLDESVLRGLPALEEFVEKCAVVEIAAGAVIIRQGESDNALYIIISGTVETHVNGRLQAERRAGQHVGEIALIDPTARRTGTVVAAEHSLVMRCEENVFTDFANANPKLWRRLSVELSRRLSERNRRIKAPRTEPTVFIGCSSETLSLAQEIQAIFDHDDFNVEIWTDGVFNASKTPIEDLTSLIERIDFAIILVTPDDQIESRKQGSFGPRDNVVFELGLAIGAIGRTRTVMLIPRGKDIKIPSDLLGVRPIDYPLGNESTLKSRLGPACLEIRKLINRLGPL